MKLTPFGEAVRALRTKKRLSLKHMSDALGLTPVELSALEFGEAPLTPETVEKILRYFEQQGAEASELTVLQSCAQQSYDILRVSNLKDKGCASFTSFAVKPHTSGRGCKAMIAQKILLNHMST